MISKNIKFEFVLVIEFILSTFSIKEFKRFLNDNVGGLVLSFDDLELPDKDWIEYIMLQTDESVKSINHEDLPEDFCPKACKLVDEFHWKTVNENVEWMLYFDYATGDVIYCWKGEEDTTGGEYDKIHLKIRNIASLHNHPKRLYSFPSLDNFDILENDFEDYEIICADSLFWEIEFKGILEDEMRKQIIFNLYDLFQQVYTYVFFNSKYANRIGKTIDEMYSNQIINYLNTNYKNIHIKKKVYA